MEKTLEGNQTDNGSWEEDYSSSRGPPRGWWKTGGCEGSDETDEGGGEGKDQRWGVWGLLGLLQTCADCGSDGTHTQVNSASISCLPSVDKG